MLDENLVNTNRAPLDALDNEHDGDMEDAEEEVSCAS
jgi:hypothetical protein